MDFLHGTTSQTSNTDLAATLGTLGIPRHGDQSVRVFQGEKEVVAFYFGENSPCGSYPTSTMIRAWDDTDFSRTHPRHALTYIKCALRSRHRLLEYANGAGRIALKKREGGQFEVIRWVSQVRPESPARPAPDLATTPNLHTEDLELACCLLACGIPFWSGKPYQRDGKRITFFFMPSSECGTFHTPALMLAWQDRQWHERNPEHPFAYLSCAMENRRRLIREIKGTVPMVVFQQAGLPHFLSLNADQKTETLFLKELKKL
jgi:hypothetical protein